MRYRWDRLFEYCYRPKGVDTIGDKARAQYGCAGRLLYTTHRLHSTLGYRSPAGYEKATT